MGYLPYNNRIALPAKFLYEEGGVMSRKNYEALCQRGRIVSLRQGKGLGNCALVDFEMLPERFKTQIIDLLGPPPSLEKLSGIMKYYTDDYEAIDFFETYKIDENTQLPIEKQKEYIANAQVLNALDLLIKETAIHRKSRGGSTAGVWRIGTEAVAIVQEATGHKLPLHESRLRQKLKDYRAEGYANLISGKFNNQSAAKIKDTQQEALLRQLLRRHNNFDNAQISRLYNEVAEKVGWKTFSDTTVGRYRTKWKMLTYIGTQGVTAFKNNIGMHVKRKAPSKSMIYWTTDGWQAELYYQVTEDKTHYNERLTVVFVMDPHSKYPVGYAIGKQENSVLIKEALRNAILHTQQVFGRKCKVLQIQSDNYAKKKMKPLYEASAERYTPAEAKNAKSKVIEPFNHYFNIEYCQYANNWSGCGVKSKKQPNREFLDKIKGNFPDFEGACRQLEGMIALDRAKKYEAFVSGYNDLPEEDRKFFTDEEFLLHFGDNTGYTNRLSHSGIVATIMGDKKHYDSFNPAFRNYGSLDWQIKYNPSDTSEVLAFNQESGLSFMLHQKHDQPMALYDREEGDGAELAKIQGYNKSLLENYKEVLYEDQEVVADFFNKKELEGTRAKNLMTDSLGQHKDNRKRLTAQKAKAKTEKAEMKIEKQEAKNWQTQQTEYLSEKININQYLQND